MRKRLISLISVLLLLCASFSFAENTEDAIVTDDGNFPELNEQGFMNEGEFLYENEDDGIWRYCSPHLKVEIFRKSQTKPKITWYEAEIISDGTDVFRMIPADAENWLTKTEYPYKITRANKTVFAINNDYAQLRKKQKAKTGIIIRNAQLLSEKTKARNKTPFPNLDCMALYPDGNMEVFWSDEKTAQEYLDSGVKDVLSFGPWLIRDGELNTDGIKKFATTKQPRTAIGQTEPCHWFAIVTEGRVKRSNGVNVEWLADRFLELGCRTAFNLDGGETCSIVFMGHQLNKLKDTKRVSSRTTADILGIGTSDLVREPGSAW